MLVFFIFNYTGLKSFGLQIFHKFYQERIFFSYLKIFLLFLHK